MIENPSKQELQNRIDNLFKALNTLDQEFDTAVIMSKVNQYYFTGTMQDGLLILNKTGKTVYFVRKSFDRAKLECPLDFVYKISSYKDILNVLPSSWGNTFIETEIMPLATLDRLKKYFKMEAVHSLDKVISGLRAVKSAYEAETMTESGRQHQEFLEKIVPEILKEGMSETDLFTELYGKMVKLGHHGVSRVAMFQIEMIAGQIGFGENSLYPTNFDGPGGMLGMSPAVPIIGSRNRYLKKGDLVFVDVGYGILGYHTDKTQVYSFGVKPADEVIKIHNACLEVLNQTADRLKAGNIPAEIYQEISSSLPAELVQNFMGYGEGVKFLGHGVGLHIDEMPVISSGFKTPLQENMVIALEPKCGIAGVGTVGVEETYLVKTTGAVCLTGGAKEIMVV